MDRLAGTRGVVRRHDPTEILMSNLGPIAQRNPLKRDLRAVAKTLNWTSGRNGLCRPCTLRASLLVPPLSSQGTWTVAASHVASVTGNSVSAP